MAASNLLAKLFLCAKTRYEADFQRCNLRLRNNLIFGKGSLVFSVYRQRRAKFSLVVALLAAMMLNLLASTFAQTANAAPNGPQSSDRVKNTNSTQLIAFNAPNINNGLVSSSLNVRNLPSIPVLMPQWFATSTQTALGLDNQNPTRPPAWSGDWANFGMLTGTAAQLPQPFNSIKVTWDGYTPTGTKIEMDVRASKDGQNWTLWDSLTNSGQTASFDGNAAYLFTQYRVRLFSKNSAVTPLFKNIHLQANVQNLSSLPVLNEPSAAPQVAPTFQVYASREGLVGGRTANGHIIQSHDHFVSLPSWTALNDYGHYDYQVRITTAAGNSAVAPVWDSGPWNFADNYWDSNRNEFKDLPVGKPESEAAYINGYNGGVNENGAGIYNPSGIDIGDGTFWDDLKLGGALTDSKLSVTFLWKGADPVAVSVNTPTVGSTSNTSTIKWQTTAAANSWVEYGFTTKYDQFSPIDNNMVTSHSIQLTDLTPGHTYHFRVHSAGVNGADVVSGDGTFTTAKGFTTALTPWQNDKGIGVTVAKTQDAVTLAGGRVNNSYWSDNPRDDFTAGASTKPNQVNANGSLDFDFVPNCDAKGQNCTFGFGSGYKAYVEFKNSKGDIVRIGLIHGAGISDKSATLMVEGTVGGKSVNQYYPPDVVDISQPHHLHVFWFNAQVYITFDYAAHPNPVAFHADGLTISFAGAGRAKGDVVATNFQNIAFGDSTVASS